MIKFIELVKARASISIERFHVHWRAVHAPLVAKAGRMTGYIQNHRIDDGIWDFQSSGYHGILEAWFPDLSQQQQFANSSEYRDYAGQDEPNFIDLKNSPLCLADEHIIKGGAARKQNEVRAFLLIRRRSDVSPERFKNDLLGDVGAQISKTVPMATQIIATIPANDPAFTHGEHYDAYVALSFPSLAAADAVQSGAHALRDAIAEIADVEHSASMLSEQFIGRAYPD
jgi:hypothetical protein